MKLSKLPHWDKLTPEEKKRLKKVSQPRVDSQYNVAGDLSISEKELKKAKKNE